MITLSFDPDAGTLYWYFVELNQGSTADEAECASSLLLDAEGNIIGVELELAPDIKKKHLSFALAHPQAQYNTSDYVLTIKLFDEEVADVQPLHEPAILDFDDSGRLQGCEVLPSEEFQLASRLERLGELLVDIEDDEDEDDEDGPVVFTDLPPVEALVSSKVDENYRTGFVTLVGRPNVGKSTLLNAILGQKVAIVSRKPQTTRMAMRGILSRDDAQIIFVDTPGIHDPRNKLGNFMVEQARRTIPDADVVCFLADLTQTPTKLDKNIADLVQNSRAPRILVFTKRDRRNPEREQMMEAYRALGKWDAEIAISARQRWGLDQLLDEIVKRLPVGPPHYPTDQLTDQTVREQVAELIREQVLRNTGQEVPHGTAVEIEEWEERDNATYVRATIYVEKESQKGIIIGAGGSMLKKIGSSARPNVEELIGRKAFLELWVKPRLNWRDDPSSLHWLGYE
jgi:GTP-binding protein Era